MVYINRKIQERLNELVKKGKNILLLGARQTGKTTLLATLNPDITISFIQPRTRLKYEADPSILADEIEAAVDTMPMPLVVIDEIQKVPLIMDVVQDLIDRKLAQFLLTGSSARKLKYGSHVNMLPGRVIPLHLDPLMISELTAAELNLENLILNGSLPEIITSTGNNEKQELLEAYVSLYLEEEVRAEALVRNVTNFSKFLTLAASESGYIINFSKLSQIIGVNRKTIAEYFQILEDCLIAERIEPLTISKTRHKLAKSDKYLIFDMGVRRIAANEGTELSEKSKGYLFEQFIGLELLRQARVISSQIKLQYWRDNDGPEVDWVLALHKKYIPIEVKYTTNPNQQDAKHLQTFINEYKDTQQGFIICRIDRPRKITDEVTALPWQDLNKIVELIAKNS